MFYIGGIKVGSCNVDSCVVTGGKTCQLGSKRSEFDLGNIGLSGNDNQDD